MSVIPPPPASPRRDDGCWKWGLIGCGGLGCVVVIAFAALLYFGAKSPMVKQAITSMVQAQAAVQQLQTVGRALDQYVADKKKYPTELKELVPQYLSDEQTLHISREPNAPRIWYRRPAQNSPGETIVLQVEITPPIAMPDAKPWQIQRRKDGQLAGTEYVYRDQFGREQRVGIGR